MVAAFNPEMVAVVPVGVVATVVPLNTRYPVAPLDAFHDSVRLVGWMPLARSPVGAAGGVPVPEPVVADTVPDFADSPAEFVALTANVYVVFAASPVTVAEVPGTVVTVLPR